MDDIIIGVVLNAWTAQWPQVRLHEVEILAVAGHFNSRL